VLPEVKTYVFLSGQVTIEFSIERHSTPVLNAFLQVALGFAHASPSPVTAVRSCASFQISV